MDYQLILEALEAIKRQAIQEAIKHVRDGVSLENSVINRRITATLDLIKSEHLDATTKPDANTQNGWHHAVDNKGPIQ